MRRVLALLAAVALLLAAAAPVTSAHAAGSAKSPQNKRSCVTKVVKKKTKHRKAVKKRVCRVTKSKKKTTSSKPRTSAPATTAPANVPRPWFPTPAPAAGTPAAPAAGTPTTPSTPTAEPPATPVCEDDSMWLGAFAREDTTLGFRLDLSRECIRAGRVIVRYLNTDQAHHNLYARGLAPAAPAREVVDLVAPKAIDTGDTPGQEDGTVDLTAGRWQLYCAIPGHEVMTRDLTVTPAS